MPKGKPSAAIARDAKRRLQYQATLNITIPHETDEGLGALLILTEDFEIEESLHIAFELLSQAMHGKRRELQVHDTCLADRAQSWLRILKAALPEATRRAKKLRRLEPA